MEMIDNPPEWLEEWWGQVGAKLEDGLREAPSFIAFARENGTVYHTYTVMAPDPFVAPYHSLPARADAEAGAGGAAGLAQGRISRTEPGRRAPRVGRTARTAAAVFHRHAPYRPRSSLSRTRRGGGPTTARRRSRRDPSACGPAGRSRPLRARGRGRSLRRSGRRSRPIARTRSGPVPRRRTPPTSVPHKRAFCSTVSRDLALQERLQLLLCVQEAEVAVEVAAAA